MLPKHMDAYELAVSRRHPRIRLLWMAMAVAATTLLTIAWEAAALVWAAVGFVTFLGSYLHGRQRTIAHGVTVTRDGDQLRFFAQGRNVLELGSDSIRCGFFNGVDRVLLVTDSHGDISVGCYDDNVAEQLLDIAGVALDRRAAHLPLGSGGFSSQVFDSFAHLLIIAAAAAIMVIATLLSGGLSLWTLALLPLSLLLGALLWRKKRRALVIGSDGVLIRGWLTSRFIPFIDVQRFDGDEHTVVLELSDGQRLPLAVNWEEAEPHLWPKGAFWGGEALFHRLKGASDRLHRADAPVGIDHLDRRGRSAQQWSGALQRIAGSASDFRAPAMKAGRLANIVESLPASPERRVAAAYALSRLDEREKLRIEPVAEACADPRLAKALRSAAAGELDVKAVEDVMESFREREAEREAEQAPAVGRQLK